MTSVKGLGSEDSLSDNYPLVLLKLIESSNKYISDMLSAVMIDIDRAKIYQYSTCRDTLHLEDMKSN